MMGKRSSDNKICLSLRIYKCRRRIRLTQTKIHEDRRRVLQLAKLNFLRVSALGMGTASVAEFPLGIWERDRLIV